MAGLKAARLREPAVRQMGIYRRTDRSPSPAELKFVEFLRIDVDLVAFFDPQSKIVREGVEPGPVFVRMTQALAKLLQERTVTTLPRAIT